MQHSRNPQSSREFLRESQNFGESQTSAILYDGLILTGIYYSPMNRLTS